MDPARNKNKSKKGCFVLLIFLFIIAAIGIGGFLYLKDSYESSLVAPLSDSKELITFTIEEGSSTDQIIQSLVDLEILTDRKGQFMKIYLSQNNLAASLQAGTFSIPKDLTIKELVKTLQNAGIPEVWVTLQEGLRADEFGEILATEFSTAGGQFDKNKFMQLTIDPLFISQFELNGEPTNLEGFLFPDRYLLPLESTEEEIITILVNNFKEKVSDTYTYEDVIIASMLEREGRNPEEKRMIADIINRRLQEKWYLGIDATLLYYYKDWKRELTFVELEEDQPYNTRIRIGLPPTPISNPGLVSIKAALDPQENEYYYYLHDNDGIIRYARTFEEHNTNISLYLQ